MRNLFVLLLMLPLFAVAQKKGGPAKKTSANKSAALKQDVIQYNIVGKVTGFADGTEVSLKNGNDNSVVAKSEFKGGSFTMTGKVEEPTLYLLILGNEQQHHIYVENKKITVSGSKEDPNSITIVGSTSHDDFSHFRNVFNPLFGEINNIGTMMQQTHDAAQREALMKTYETTVKNIKSEVGKFVASKPASIVSPFVMYVTAQLVDDPFTMEQQFQLLHPSIQNTQIGKALGEFITYNKVGAVGTDALEFSLPDENGKAVALSSFKGKYVLIDFWASWCKPCRVENPHVVSAFQKFKDKNFTVLGVSLDKEKDSWVKAIKDDKLTWTQVSDLKFWNSEAAQLYHVTGIPQNFLIDPNGKIVAKNLRGEDLETKLCQFLGCN